MRKIAGTLLAATLLGCAALSATAQPYPDRPLKVIVPWPPGGTTDSVARIVSDRMSAVLGQALVIDNRAGASGQIGTLAVAKAPPDGYTVGVVNSASHTIPLGGGRKLPYNPLGDFSPIGQLATVPLVLVINQTLPVSNLEQLVAWAKANPGKLNVGTASQGTLSHLSAELLKSMTKAEFLFVHYKGDTPVIADLLSGQVNAAFVGPVSVLGLIESGRLRPIGVSTRQRLSLLPNVPTIAELGYPSYDIGGWVSLAVPRGTPKPIVDKLHAALEESLRTKSVIQSLQMKGYEPAPAGPAEVEAMMAAEVQTWKALVRDNGLKLAE